MHHKERQGFKTQMIDARKCLSVSKQSSRILSIICNGKLLLSPDVENFSTEFANISKLPCLQPEQIKTSVLMCNDALCFCEEQNPFETLFPTEISEQSRRVRGKFSFSWEQLNLTEQIFLK